MKRNKPIYIDDRPAYMMMVDEERHIANGYTLLLDFNNLTASIIILKKGGSISMIKTVVKAKEGWEELYDKVMLKKENFEARKQEAIKVAIAEVEDRFAEESILIDKVYADVTETYEVEVEDEIVEPETSEEMSVENPDQVIY